MLYYSARNVNNYFKKFLRVVQGNGKWYDLDSESVAPTASKKRGLLILTCCRDYWVIIIF